MDNQCNEHLVRALELTEQMLQLADMGDDDRTDAGCGIMYGMMRDCAYKIRTLAENEIYNHKRAGKWVEPHHTISFL